MRNQPSQINFNQNSFSCQKHSSVELRISNPREDSVARTTDSLDFELIIDTLNILFSKMYDEQLGTVEVLILEGVWQNQTYSKIAQKNNYSSDYVTNVAAPKLFKKLSKLIECRITKKTSRSLITKYVRENITTKPQRHLAKRASIKQNFNLVYNYYSNVEREQKLEKKLFLKDAILLAQII